MSFYLSKILLDICLYLLLPFIADFLFGICFSSLTHAQCRDLHVGDMLWLVYNVEFFSFQLELQMAFFKMYSKDLQLLICSLLNVSKVLLFE